MYAPSELAHREAVYNANVQLLEELQANAVAHGQSTQFGVTKVCGESHRIGSHVVALERQGGCACGAGACACSSPT